MVYEIVDLDQPSARHIQVGTLPSGHGDGASCLGAPSPIINAADDDFSSTPVQFGPGGTAGNVLTNDTIAGASFASTDVTSTLTDDDGITGAAIASDGTLSIPAGTTPGTYTLFYEICRTSNADICDTASIDVVVVADTVVADDDAFGPSGGNVLTNDSINSDPVDPNDVTLTLTSDGGLTGASLGAGGVLTVPSNAAPGTYTLTYNLCQNALQGNCDAATITVTILDPNRDTDKDGLPDPKEKSLGSDPNDPDTDNDRLKDGAEYNGFTMAKNVIRCDRSSAAIGKIRRTSLLRPDTDRDGLKDGQEVFGVKIFQIVRTPGGRSYTLGLLKSHPNRPDTDFDGLKDKVEVTGSAAGKFNFAKTNPANCHTDLGLRSDGYELSRGKNPVRAGEH